MDLLLFLLTVGRPYGSNSNGVLPLSTGENVAAWKRDHPGEVLTAGRLAHLTILERFGPDHFSIIGRRGAASRTSFFSYA